MTDVELIRWRAFILSHPDGPAWLCSLLQNGINPEAMTNYRPPWEPVPYRFSKDEIETAHRAARIATMALEQQVAKEYDKEFRAALPLK